MRRRGAVGERDMRYLDDAERDEIHRLREQGAGLDEIAERFGVSTETVRYVHSVHCQIEWLMAAVRSEGTVEGEPGE